MSHGVRQNVADQYGTHIVEVSPYAKLQEEYHQQAMHKCTNGGARGTFTYADHMKKW